MSWSIGYDEKWQRDIGYGVPAEITARDESVRTAYRVARLRGVL